MRAAIKSVGRLKIVSSSLFLHVMSLSPDGTRPGYLPAWEVAKAAAYDVVLDHLSDHLGMSVPDLLGEAKAKWVAKQLTLQGGGNPSRRSRGVVTMRRAAVNQHTRIIVAGRQRCSDRIS